MIQVLKKKKNRGGLGVMTYVVDLVLLQANLWYLIVCEKYSPVILPLKLLLKK